MEGLINHENLCAGAMGALSEIPTPCKRANDLALLPSWESRQIWYPLGGPVMAKSRTDSALNSVDAVIDSLTIQGIAFHGPFRTQGERVFFVVDRHIFLDSELADLLEQNNLNRAAILELGKQIEARPQ
jgi:hypothetical protein